MRGVRRNGVPGQDRYLRDDDGERRDEGCDLAAQAGREITEAAMRDGMVRLRDDGLVKAASGITTIEEVLKNVV
jgi:hypothetical protein